MADTSVIHFYVSCNAVDGECPDCGFDAMVQVTLTHLSAHGVTESPQAPICGRCRLEQRRQAEQPFE